MKTFDIPRDRIFNSRTSEILPGILRETGGKGVDVVLNSLSGELLHASVRVPLASSCPPPPSFSKNTQLLMS